LPRFVLKVELHSHTGDDPVDRIPYSTCDLIDRAATLGYDALAITLHDRQLDVRPYAGYAAERGMVLIPGIERTLEGRHVLLLNFSRRCEEVESFQDLAALRASEPGGLVVAPHPFFPVHGIGGRMSEYPDLFDAVEFNAMYTTTLNFNDRGARWAREYRKPIVGNGDIHRLEQLGTTYSLVDAERDPGSICAAIAAGRVQLKTNPLTWPVAVRIFTSIIGASLIPKADETPQPTRVTVG
jgi:predicted metal-dependent phosphoesterase TrpH